MIAGLVAAQVVGIVWRVATKSKPPKDTQDLGVATFTAVLFSGLLGAATAVAQTLAGRHALRSVAGRQQPSEEAAEH
jgi:hypothetical protein